MLSARFGPMPSTSCKSCRRLLDDVEHLLAEGLDQLLGVDRADAFDHPRGEILLDALGGGRRRRTQKVGAELHTVRAVVDPPAARLDELAGTDRCGMADDGNQVALAAGLHPQDAKAAILVVERNALDEAREVLAFGCSLRPTEARLFHSCGSRPGIQQHYDKPASAAMPDHARRRVVNLRSLPSRKRSNR